MITKKKLPLIFKILIGIVAVPIAFFVIVFLVFFIKGFIKGIFVKTRRTGNVIRPVLYVMDNADDCCVPFV